MKGKIQSHIADIFDAYLEKAFQYEENQYSLEEETYAQLVLTPTILKNDINRKRIKSQIKIK